MKSEIIPSKMELQEALASDVNDAQEVLVFVKDVSIRSHQDLEVGVSYLQVIKEQSKAVDEKRKSFIDPLKGIIDNINDFFKPVLDSLKSAETSIKNKIEIYSLDTQKERDELLNSVAKEKSLEAKSEIIEQASALALPKIKGLQLRETWTGEVSDEMTLINYAIEHDRSLLLINEKLLMDYTKREGKDPQIPGWRAYVKTTVAIGGAK